MSDYNKPSVFDDGASHPSRELVLYIDNTQRVHKLKEDVWRELVVATHVGRFDETRALVAFRAVVDAAVEAFGSENSNQAWYQEAEWDVSFPESDRQSAVEHYAWEFGERFQTGDFDYLLPTDGPL